MKRRSANNRIEAFTLIELLALIAIVALLVAFALPALSPPRKRAQRINCVNNLKQVGLSFRLWAGDNGDKYPMQVSVTNGGTMELVRSGIVFPTFQVMSNELSTPNVVVCPEDKQRTSATNFTTDFNNSRVSFFVGLDADESKPTMLLAGDRNLTTNGVAVRRSLVALTTNSFAGWTARIHKTFGNIALADGSVQQVSAADLQKLIEKTGVITNRLVLP